MLLNMQKSLINPLKFSNSVTESPEVVMDEVDNVPVKVGLILLILAFCKGGEARLRGVLPLLLHLGSFSSPCLRKLVCNYNQAEIYHKKCPNLKLILLEVGLYNKHQTYND